MSWPNEEFLKIASERGVIIDVNDSVGKGWHALVSRMFDELIATGWDKRVSQIKEKFGTLRVYISDNQAGFQDIIDKYETLSATICEHCGEPGKTVSINYWMKTSCPEHTSVKAREWGN